MSGSAQYEGAVVQLGAPVLVPLVVTYSHPASVLVVKLVMTPPEASPAEADAEKPMAPITVNTPIIMAPRQY